MPTPGSRPNRVIDHGPIRGIGRLEAELAKNTNLADTDAYDDYILELKSDPSDPEYNAALTLAKAKAWGRKKLRGITQPKKPTTPTLYQMTPEEAAAQKANAEDALRGKTGIGTDMTGRRSEHTTADNTPIIKGLPVGAEAILAEAEEAGIAPASPWLKQFLANMGISLGPDFEEVAAKSGEYVYVEELSGTYADTATEKGGSYSNPVYLYKTDASASITTLSSDEIKAYQAQLGLQETGLVDPKLQALWDQAVETGQIHARAGQKVELKFIFDTLVAVAVANGGLGGGGGGGANPMVDTDYYFAMMQVLGDISGVKS